MDSQDHFQLPSAPGDSGLSLNLRAAGQRAKVPAGWAPALTGRVSDRPTTE